MRPLSLKGLGAIVLDHTQGSFVFSDRSKRIKPSQLNEIEQRRFENTLKAYEELIGNVALIFFFINQFWQDINLLL